MAVIINAIEYKGVASIDLAFDSTVQAHPVESGFSVSDHVTHATPDISVSLTLGGATDGATRDTEYTRLKGLKDSSTLFTFICDIGSFDNVVIQTISPAITKSINTYACELTLKQIRQAELTTKNIKIIDKDGVCSYSPDSPAGTPATEGLQDKEVDDEPEKSEGSWLDGLTAWVGGLFS